MGWGTEGDRVRIFVQAVARVKRDVRLGDLHPLFAAYVCLRSTGRKKIVSEGSRNGIPMRLIDSNLPESHYRAKKLPRPVPHNVCPPLLEFLPDPTFSYLLPVCVCVCTPNFQLGNLLRDLRILHLRD